MRLRRERDTELVSKHTADFEAALHELTDAATPFDAGTFGFDRAIKFDLATVARQASYHNPDYDARKFWERLFGAELSTRKEDARRRAYLASWHGAHAIMTHLVEQGRAVSNQLAFLCVEGSSYGRGPNEDWLLYGLPDEPVRPPAPADVSNTTDDSYLPLDDHPSIR